jgi:hypothetical protein
LFLIVKPKLLTLPWFAALWNWFVKVRGAVLGWFGLDYLREQLAKQPPPALKRASHR